MSTKRKRTLTWRALQASPPRPKKAANSSKKVASSVSEPAAKSTPSPSTSRRAQVEEVPDSDNDVMEVVEDVEETEAIEQSSSNDPEQSQTTDESPDQELGE